MTRTVKMKNKYAFLILAHTDPKQLRRLVHALDHPGFDIFIHVDRKCNLRSFGFSQYTLQHSRLTVLDKRYRIQWGHISIVSATLALYRVALALDHYDRFVTLSGLDYPLLSNEEMAEKLAAPDVEFIMGNVLESNSYHKVENFYFWNLGKARRPVAMICYAMGIRKSRFLMVGQNKWDIYFAPQWHALSLECVQYVLNTVEAHPHILRYFSHSYAPDELLIPTILFNSSTFRDKALCSTFPENTHYNKKTAIHYVNYEPIVDILRENRYDELMSSQKLFCRKMKTEISTPLMDMIDKTRSSFSERIH